MKRLALTLAAVILVAASCAKTEEKGPVAVTKVSLDKKEAALTEGATITLTATVLPENASDKSCRWSSGDNAVATVSDAGVVSGISAGNTVIRVFAGEMSDSCSVSVVKEEILVQKASFDKKELEMFTNGCAVLVLTTEPAVVTEVPDWQSSDSTVATVDQAGVVTALAAGKATVSASFKKSGKKASCAVTVTDPLKLSKIDASELIVQGTRVNERTDTLRVARGETADLQIHVKANTDVDALNAELLYFCKADGGESGKLLEPELFWAREVKCTRYWEEWWGYPYYELNPGNRMFPDPLMPVGEWEISLKKNGYTCLWCDINIPRGFGDGLYKAALRIRGNCGNEAVWSDKEFYVQVYPVDLPESQSLKVINWLYNGFYDPMNNGSHDYDEYEMRGIVMDFMQQYGQNGWLMGDNAPTGPDLSIENTRIVCNFDRFLKEMEFMEEHCPDLSIVEGSAFCSYTDYSAEQTADDMRCPVYFIEDGSIKLAGLPPTDPRTHDWFVNLFSQFGEFAKAHSLKNGRRIIDVYAQSIMDEPQDRHVSGYDMVASFIKEGCADVRIIEPIETYKINDEYLDYPIPNLDNLTTHNDDYKARGQQTQWLYVCQRPQGNIANRVFGMRALKPRIIHWCNWFFNAEGFLHWGLNRWDFYYEKDKSGKRTYSPEIYDKDMFLGQYPGGDYFAIWPGNKKVYPSIRLCNMRDGVRDYELLKMVAEKDPSKAGELCEKVVYPESAWEQLSSPTGQATTGKYLFYDENVVNFRQTRREMLEFLAK